MDFRQSDFLILVQNFEKTRLSPLESEFLMKTLDILNFFSVFNKVLVQTFSQKFKQKITVTACVGLVIQYFSMNVVCYYQHTVATSLVDRKLCEKSIPEVDHHTMD